MKRAATLLVKTLLPRRLTRRVAEAATLSGPARTMYLRLLLTSGMGTRPGRPVLPTGEGPLVFICHGNIIRSAMAEAMFRREASQWPGPVTVASAGMFAVDGRAADPRAAHASAALGASLEGHRAHALDEATARTARLLVVMDHLNEAVLLARYPWARPKVALLGALAEDFDPATGAAIADPFSGSEDDVEATARRIARAVSRLALDLHRPDHARPR